MVGAASALAPALVSGESAKGGRLEVFVLPPLTFAEHLAMRGCEAELFPGAGKSGHAAALQAGALPRLDLEFQYYVNFGGFPEGTAGVQANKPGAAPSIWWSPPSRRLQAPDDLTNIRRETERREPGNGEGPTRCSGCPLETRKSPQKISTKRGLTPCDR